MKNKETERLDAVDNRLLNLTEEKYKQEHRKGLITYSKSLVIGWYIFIALVIVCDGFHLWGFSISNSIILALVSTSIIQTLGVLIIVYKFFFAKQ